MKTDLDIFAEQCAEIDRRTGNEPPPSVRVGADVRQVAAFRLPVSVKLLAEMADSLTREYGKDLTMRQVGDSLIIEQPNAGGEGRPHAAGKDDGHEQQA
jgi:hypothetical protein